MSRWWNTQRVQGRTARRRGQPRVEGLESRCLLSVTINEFPLPAGYNNPTGITTGSDGNLWFTERSSDKIGQLNPTTHAVVEFTTPTAASRNGTVPPNGCSAGRPSRPSASPWPT